MKLLLVAMRTTSLIEADLLPLLWMVPSGGAAASAPVDTKSPRPRSLHRKTGKLGCFQLRAAQRLGW